MPIRAGDAVRLLPEFMDGPDDTFPRYALEDEDGGRVLVVADLGWRVNPTERVEVFMLEVLPTSTPED